MVALGYSASTAAVTFSAVVPVRSSSSPRPSGAKLTPESVSPTAEADPVTAAAAPAANPARTNVPPAAASLVRFDIFIFSTSWRGASG